MTADTSLREHLQSRADEHAISVSSLKDITAAGDRSIRRNRVVGGFGVFVLVMVGLFGLVGLRSTDTPTTMFAGLDLDLGFDGAPATVIVTEDGWLGAVVIQDDEDAPLNDRSGEIYLATSNDGESWELAEPTGLMSTWPELAIDEHNGRHWLAAADGDQAYLAFSDDLEDWTRVEAPAGPGSEIEIVEGMQRTVASRKIIANSAGIMAMFTYGVEPDFLFVEEKLGIDPGQSCGLTFGAAQVSLRPCGESEWVHYAVEGIDRSMSEPQTSLVFSSDGETFERIDPPEVDDNPGPAFDGQNLYSTDTGFGVADLALHESTNGIDWTTLDVDRSASPDTMALSTPSLAAARGDQRLTTPTFHVDTVNVQLTVDGQQWAAYNLDEALGIDMAERNRTFNVNAIAVGEAGWAISGSVYEQRTFINGATNVTVPVGDLELRANRPAGPAELVVENGEVVASWDNFELGDLRRNEYVRIDNDVFTILDADGETLAQDSRQAVFSALQASASPPLSVVVFSPDGETWTQLHSDIAYVAGIAVGDDEVVMVHYPVEGLTSVRLPIEAD